MKWLILMMLVTSCATNKTNVKYVESEQQFKRRTLVEKYKEKRDIEMQKKLDSRKK